MRTAAFAIAAIGLAACQTPVPEGPEPPVPSASTTSVSSGAGPSTTAASAGSVTSPAPSPASRWAACDEPPEGMACIPGGPATIGSDDGQAREKPRHEVEISTFYLDLHEVTNAGYAACEKARACKTRIPATPAFMKPSHPAVPLTWHMAHSYCQWMGKRLPTEAEWEKAARGGPKARTFPWGDEPSTCERAQSVGCAPETTLPVGSLPAGAYGLFDMAGNGYEWVQDWASPCYGECPKACGAACLGLDPRGPCAGAETCDGHSERVLKGGSWYWPAGHGRGAWRRAKKMATGQHRYSVRCASSDATLATWPPVGLEAALPAPTLEPPAKAQVAALQKVRHDDDVMQLKVCKKVHEAQHDCRDPQSYLITNEPEQELWTPYLKNRGGGYVGIGADQNYSLIGTAKSAWAWIFDYDPAVIRLHYVMRALILEHATREAFVAGLEPRQYDATLALVRKGVQPDIDAGTLPKDELDHLQRELRMWMGGVHSRYRKRMTQPKKGKVGFDWLATEGHYRHVRRMYQQGRIALRKGNLLTDIALPDIAASARALKVPVRVFYTSNADDQWTITERYRESLRGLPFDRHSIVLRTTIDSKKVGADRHEWDYVVHHGLDFQRAIARPEVKRMRALEQEGRNHGGNLITIALPGAASTR
jgi:formylglycine-generating enzyme required for sulfatase activity